MFRTRWIRKLFAHQRRRQTVKPRKPVRLRLEALEERVTPDATTCVPGNVDVNFYGNAQSPAFIIPVAVNDNSGGVATSGTVTINLVNGNSTIMLGSATVTNGVADVDINLGALPANLSIGNYELVESFSGSGDFDASSASSTLTVSALSTTIVTTSVTFNFSNTSTVTANGSALIPIGSDADNYAVLYEGTDGHTLHVSNATINGNVGVGGTGVVKCDGHADLDGTLNFAGSGSGKFSGSGDQDDDDSGDDDGHDHGDGDGHGHDHGGDNGNGNKDDDEDSNQECVGPNAINVNDAAVTNALNAVNALSSSLAGLGTSIAINGSQTINESDGQLVTVNGVSYRVFNVTSYHMGDNDVLTINGDGSGIPVVFNFAGNDDVNLSGDVVLTNGLVPDQVLWNVTGSGATVHLHGNDSDRPSSAFQGIILAPNDTIDLENANLIGRVFGGDSADMQIVGQNTITAPTTVVTIPGSTSSSFTISAEVSCSSAAVSGGTVTFEVVAGNEIIDLGTATVGANGVATLTVTNPTTLQELASLMPGNFELIETFSGNSPFAGSTTTTTLTITPEQTTIVVPPNVNVTVNNNTTFNITVNVNSPSGPATSGTVTLDLVVNGQTIPLGTGTVGPNGTVTVNVNGSTISSLPAGTYNLVINFNAGPGSPNANGSTVTTLTIQAPPSNLGPAATTTTPPTGGGPGGGVSPAPGALSPMQAALELALDLAMLGNMGNPGSVGELQLFSQVFLQRPIPTSVPQLLSNIESLLPQAGPMLFPALSFAAFLDTDLPIENPM